MNKLLTSYQQLSDRDKRAVQLLGLALAVLLAMQLVILPTFNFYKNAKSGYHNNFNLLTWMEANSSSAKQLEASSKTEGLEALSLLEAVSQSAARAKLDISRIQPEGDNLARLWFDTVPFNGFVAWLYELTNRYSLTIDSVSIDQTDQPGKVDVQLSLGD